MNAHELMSYTVHTSTNRRGTTVASSENDNHEEDLNIPAGVNKRTAQRNVEYPIFEACRALTNDAFWNLQLYLAARGKFHRGFYYQNSFLRQKKKTRVRTVYIPPDPVQAIEAFIRFMHEAGIFSNIDTDARKEQVNFHIASYQTEAPVTWSGVPKKLRNSYVESYIDRCAKQYDLSIKAVESLKDTINFGIIMGVFDKDNIFVANFQITTINGLIYKSETDTFAADENLWKTTMEAVKKSYTSPEYDDRDLSRPLSMYQPGGNIFRSKWKKQLKDFRQITSMVSSPTNVKFDVDNIMEVPNVPVAANQYQVQQYTASQFGTGQIIMLED